MERLNEKEEKSLSEKVRETLDTYFAIAEIEYGSVFFIPMESTNVDDLSVLRRGESVQKAISVHLWIQE